jgi:hypothetical protein
MPEQTNNQTTAPLSPGQAARVLIYEHAYRLIDRLEKRFEFSSEYIEQMLPNGILGALDGVEGDIQVLRTLMIFDRDHVQPKTK